MNSKHNYQCLSGSVLKLLAVITMIIDHIASALLRDNETVVVSLASHDLTLYYLLRSIGRIAFPLYAFLLVEGFEHTSDRKKYGLRLLLFAFISEIPWNLEHWGSIFHPTSQNVFFTLFFGFLGLCIMEQLEEKIEKRNVLLLLGLVLLCIFSLADYGCSGFGFILMLWLLRKLPIQRAIVGSCFLSSTWRAGIAFIPISFYNGKRGFIKGAFPKYFFYAIYPLHMLILFAIKKSMGGY